jgi:hypothetical protein
MLDTIENIAKNAFANGDSPDKASARFVQNLSRLVSFISDVNKFVTTARGEGAASPIPPLYLMLATNGISSISAETAGDLSTTFLLRASDLYADLKSREAHRFKPIVNALFAEIPSTAVETVSNFICSSEMPPESLKDVFEYVDSLLRISIKREAMIRDSGIQLKEGSLKITVSALEQGIELFFVKK